MIKKIFSALFLICIMPTIAGCIHDSFLIGFLSLLISQILIGAIGFLILTSIRILFWD